MDGLLHDAINNKDIDTLEILLIKGVAVDTVIKYVTPIDLAIRLADSDMIMLLIMYGSDLNQRDSMMGFTLLHNAIRYSENLRIDRYVVITKLLIDNGIDIDGPDTYGCTPLHREICSFNLDSCRFLLDAGADIDRACNSGDTALFMMIYNKDLESVKFLIDRGANKDIKNKRGDTILEYAIRIKADDIVRYLKDILDT